MKRGGECVRPGDLCRVLACVWILWTAGASLWGRNWIGGDSGWWGGYHADWALDVSSRNKAIGLIN